ncbi:MAG: hypothetical protein FWF29_03870 [Treponema sp.]|nr:hypothetical protein [Treponema sp.]
MRSFLVRLLNLMTGLLFYAFGIVISIKANIGYAPWEVFHVGLTYKTGLSLGLISIIVGVVIVIIVTILREKLGIGTIFNMVFIGFFIDMIFPRIPISKNPIAGTIILISGLFLIAIGSYFYMKSAFGVGPRDNLMVVLAKRTKMPVGLCRGIIELLVTLIGWLLGGMVWFGTIISVVAIGFCIQLVFRLLRFDVTSVKHETLGETYATLRRIIPWKMKG